MFFVGMAIAAVASIGVVFGAKIVCDNIASDIKKKADAVYNDVHSEENQKKLDLLAEKEGILESISKYAGNLQEAQRLFEMQPKGSDPRAAFLLYTVHHVRFTVQAVLFVPLRCEHRQRDGRSRQ